MDIARSRSTCMPNFAFGAFALSLVCALVLSGCWLETSTNEPAGGHFVELGSLPGYASSEAAAVSPDGSVVVGTSTSPAGFRQAFRWNAAQGMRGLGFLLGGTLSSAKGVSAKGAVVIGDADGGAAPGLHAFRWSVAMGLVELPGLRGSNLCAAAGVSAAG